MAGNIGPTMLQTLADALDRAAAAQPAGAAIRKSRPMADPPALPIGNRQAAPTPDATRALPEVWVLELSSFQLDGVAGFAAGRRGGAQYQRGPPRLARQHATPMSPPRRAIYGPADGGA